MFRNFGKYISQVWDKLKINPTSYTDAYIIMQENSYFPYRVGKVRFYPLLAQFYPTL